MSDLMSRDRVLVAGAGIAGLALTRALRQRGVSVLALERLDGAGNGGLAINLPGNAIHALTNLGLGDAISTKGAAVRRREYRTHRDRLMFAVDEDVFWGPDARPRCVRRFELLELLSRETSADAVRRGFEVSSVLFRSDGVDVSSADGSTERGGLLVGADGVRSRVRQTAIGDVATGAAVLASASWRFMAPNPGVDCWTLWAAPKAMILLIPVDRGEVYGWVTNTGRKSDRMNVDKLGALFAGFPRRARHAIECALANPTSIYRSPLEEVRIPSWSRERTILIGDAAHATAPVWAQGAALALEDALALADLLANEKDWGKVGGRYEQQRRPRVAHVQDMTDRMSRAARLPSFIRTALMPIVGPRNYVTTYEPLKASIN